MGGGDVKGFLLIGETGSQQSIVENSKIDHWPYSCCPCDFGGNFGIWKHPRLIICFLDISFWDGLVWPMWMENKFYLKYFWQWKKGEFKRNALYVHVLMLYTCKWNLRNGETWGARKKIGAQSHLVKVQIAIATWDHEQKKKWGWCSVTCRNCSSESSIQHKKWSYYPEC